MPGDRLWENEVDLSFSSEEEAFRAEVRAFIAESKPKLPRALAKVAKLDPDFAEKFLNFIVKEVIHHHKAIRRGHK